MQSVGFAWQETDPAHPAQDVLIRLIGLDDVYDGRELAAFMLRHAGDGRWEGVIELPDGLRSSYQICPARDFRIPPSGLDDDGWAKVMAAGVPDPGRPILGGPVYGNPAQPASILELPQAIDQPWCQRRDGVARGTVRATPTGRQWPETLHVYSPNGIEECREPLPVVVLFDAQAWMDIDVLATFDNLIADAVVPPFLCALLGSPFGPVRVRGLTRPAVHLEYLLEELMPTLVRDFRATTDPARTVVAGQSLGGLAAVHCGLRAPRRFGAVLSQSASMWWPGGSDGELSGPRVLAAIEGSPPLRLWMEAGALEYGLAPGTRELQARLAAHGHTVAYREYQGGHDFACWRGGLGDGLAALLAGG